MKIAVIGAGISGLTAALKLQDRHEVTLFEAADYAGGHTHTHDIDLNGQRLAVDSGFIVFNERTYPNFLRLLAELGIAAQPTEMSFGVRWDEFDLEYAGSGLNGLFAQRRNLVSPRFWRLIRDWLRFNRQARSILTNLDPTVTVGQFFQQHRYSRIFRHGYFLPLGSAVWSSPHTSFAGFPLRFVLEFYRNHGMLELPKLQWFVVRGGSRTYVEAILAKLRGPRHLRTAVQQVRRGLHQVTVQAAGRPPQEFDHAVFACHSDQALRILGPEASRSEREVLAEFPYQGNTAVLHTDTSVLPRCRRAWASWNYRVAAHAEQAASVTYDMTRLQSLPTEERLLVTLNSDERIDPARVLRRMTYHHPVFTAERDAAQRRHSELINHRRLSFCGAYWGNGFHEDGVNSALAVCRVLNALPVSTDPRSQLTMTTAAAAL